MRARSKQVLAGAAKSSSFKHRSALVQVVSSSGPRSPPQGAFPNWSQGGTHMFSGMYM